MSTEIEIYQDLSKFQKEVVDTLKEIGFKHKYFSTYEKADWGDIKVDKFKKWSDILKYVHNQGKDQKRHEFRCVLGV